MEKAFNALASEIGAHFDMAMPSISIHLAIPKKAGLVREKAHETQASNAGSRR